MSVIMSTVLDVAHHITEGDQGDDLWLLTNRKLFRSCPNSCLQIERAYSLFAWYL